LVPTMERCKMGHKQTYESNDHTREEM
jgi:hypothetical protein